MIIKIYKKIIFEITSVTMLSFETTIYIRYFVIQGFYFETRSRILQRCTRLLCILSTILPIYNNKKIQSKQSTLTFKKFLKSMKIHFFSNIKSQSDIAIALFPKCYSVPTLFFLMIEAALNPANAVGTCYIDSS